MRSAAYHLTVSAARADALFASALQRGDEPSAAQVRQAIAAAVNAFDTRGCAARVAQAYGEHPETAVLRMRWARETVTGAFGGTGPVQAPVPASRPAHRSRTCCAALAGSQLRSGRGPGGLTSGAPGSGVRAAGGGPPALEITGREHPGP